MLGFVHIMSVPRLTPIVVATLLYAYASPAVAQEDFQLMQMPASYTDVIDAFDGADSLDVNARVGFLRSSSSGVIQRETSTPTTGATVPTLVDVAEHTHVTSSLRLGLDVGIYKDLAVYAALPVVLSDSRELSAPTGRSPQDVQGDLREPALDANGNPTPPGQDPMLFDVPFRAPARSGIPNVHLGIAWAPTNQQRSRDLPTWLLMLETRLATGAVLKACSDGCDSPGISDGTSALRLESRASYRFRHLEPYIGFAFELQWVSTGSELFGSDVDGLVHRSPPRSGEVTMGAELIPWEDRERYQRVAFDLRVSGAYVSEGRDVTPLFDALGSSANPYLTAPNFDRLDPDPTRRTTVAMTGVTDTSAHARINLQAALLIQAAKYMRFGLGFGVGYVTAYLLTGTDACNPSVQPASNDTRRGLCANGILNPAHRPVIDVSGKRFRLDGEVTVDLHASATAQF